MTRALETKTKTNPTIIEKNDEEEGEGEKRGGGGGGRCFRRCAIQHQYCFALESIGRNEQAESSFASCLPIDR